MPSNVSTTNLSLDPGKAAETAAALFLQSQGLQIVAHNFRIRGGEIDLICKESGTFVFVEVKYRQRSDYGGAVAALSAAQMARIRRTAQYFLKVQGLNENRTACRFDLIVVAPDGGHCEWLRNAF